MNNNSGNPTNRKSNPFSFDDDSDSDAQSTTHSQIENSSLHELDPAESSVIPELHFDSVAENTNPVDTETIQDGFNNGINRRNNFKTGSTSSINYLDPFHSPQSALISASPKHQSVADIHDNSYISNNYNQHLSNDPFNANFNDSESQAYELTDLHNQDSNSVYSSTTKLTNVNTAVYETSLNNSFLDSNVLNPNITPSHQNLPTSNITYDNSPNDSFLYSNYPEQQQQKHLLYNNTDNNNSFTNSFENNDQYFNDNYTDSSVFQPFERDIDEPDLGDTNQLFHDNQSDNLNADIQNTNFVDTGDNKVELIDGKYYSFDYPVPTQISSRIPFQGAKQLTEFNHLRYHAITTDPKFYTDNNPLSKEYIENYPLRQKIYPIQRETELMIVCTMYNEDEVLLARTLKGVFKNIKTMYNLRENENVHPFGKNTWKNVVVVIVSDGKTKIHEKSKALLTLLGVFQEGIMQEYVNDDKVNAHLFEYTTSFGIGKFDYNRINKSYKVPLVTEQTVPVQLMFLLKEENKQKINSHRWALNFLCPNLNPKVIVLLDVGTEPGPDSIYKLWKAFKDPKIGGACGEIRAMLGNHASPNDESSIFKKIFRFIYFKLSDFSKCLINPLIAAQNFEYKMSNILDKPTESSFGFVSVLPGAFSAYRYEALKGDPLKAYFHGEDMKTNFDKPAGILESNMYLAEDRILCFELVVKSSKSYLLRYVHNSYAVTDVPSQINEFINQRRRWLNGSFFAGLYSILHFYRLIKSTHSFGRKFMLVIEIIYQTINLLLSWFALSIYFLVFRILTMDIGDTFIGENTGDILAIVFLWVYIAAMVLTFILSFGNKPNDGKYLYLLAFILFAIIAIYMIFCVVCLTIESINSIKREIGTYTTFTISIALEYFKNEKFRDLTISLASTYFLYLISSIIFFDIFHLISCTIQYLLLSPAYINVLGIYAFCNMNDISWGTKGALTNEINTHKRKAVKNKENLNNEDNEEKNLLLLNENMEHPDELFKKAQNQLNGKKFEIKEPSENDLIKIENEKIEKNIKETEKNYALGRTYTVIIWLVLNFILLVVILRTGGLGEYSDYINNNKSDTASTTNTNYLMKRSYWNDLNVANTFMSVILWIVAALALIRFIGCCYYRVSFFISERRYHKRQVY